MKNALTVLIALSYYLALGQNTTKLTLTDEKFLFNEETSTWETHIIELQPFLEGSTIAVSGFVKSQRFQPQIQMITRGTTDSKIVLKYDAHADHREFNSYFGLNRITDDVLAFSLKLTDEEFQGLESVVLRVVEVNSSFSENSLKNTKVAEEQVDLAKGGGCPCPQPQYVSRSSWGTTQTWNPSQTTVTHLIVHHAAGVNASSNWAQEVWMIWDMHVNSWGWSDIGYNWLIDPNGVLYEGRYLSGSSDPTAAHMCGCNSNKMGVCLLGNYTSITPSSAAYDKLKEVLAWKSCDAGIDPLGSAFTSSKEYSTAQCAPLCQSSCWTNTVSCTYTSMDNISAHQDGCKDGGAICTQCPGNSFYPMMSGLRSDVNQFINSGCSGGCEAPNDFCSNNVPTLTVNSSCVYTQGDLCGATQSYPAGAACPSVLVQDVWYKFTSNGGQYTITLDPSSGLDGVIEARQGSCSGGVIDCIDIGGGPGNPETLVISPASGTVYLRVYDYTLAGIPPSTTTFNICVTQPTTNEPNLVATNTTFGVSGAGNNILDLEIDITNLGTGQAGGSTLNYYASTNTNITTSDFEIETDGVSILGPGQAGTEVEYNLDLCNVSGLPEGTYYIGYIIDVNDNVNEPNGGENDNSGLFSNLPITFSCCAAPTQPTINNTLNYSIDICQSQTATLVASNVCSGCSVQWNSGATSNFINVGPGTYHVTVTNGCGQTQSNNAVIGIIPDPVAPNISVSNNPICNGESTVLTVTNSANCDGCVYSWTPPGSLNPISGPQVTASPNTTTTYTATANNGCGQPTNTVIINVTPIPDTPNPTNTGPVCDGDSFILSANTLAGGYNWIGNGFSSGLQNPTVNSASFGASTYCLTVIENGCESEEGCTDVVANLNPNQPIIVQNGSHLQCNPTSGYNYQWFDINGPISGATDWQFEPVANGYFHVVIEDGNGCVNTSEVFHMITVGFVESTERFEFWPNPNQGLFEIVVPSLINEGSYQILNNLGQLVQQGGMLPDRTLIDLTGSAEGVYSLRLYEGGNPVGVERIVLTR